MSCFVTSTWVTNKCLAVYHVELTVQRLIIIKYLKINSTLPKRSVKSIKRLICKGIPGFVFLSRQVELLGVNRRNKYKIKDFFYSDDTFLKPYHFQIYSIFFFRLVQIDLRSGVLHAFLCRRQKKKFPFNNQSFFVISPEDPIHSSIFHGIICGRLWGSLAVEDHLRSILGITCGLGIICSRGSLAVLYSTDFLK